MHIVLAQLAFLSLIGVSLFSVLTGIIAALSIARLMRFKSPLPEQAEPVLPIQSTLPATQPVEKHKTLIMIRPDIQTKAG